MNLADRVLPSGQLHEMDSFVKQSLGLILCGKIGVKLFKTCKEL